MMVIKMRANCGALFELKEIGDIFKLERIVQYTAHIALFFYFVQYIAHILFATLFYEPVQYRFTACRHKYPFITR